MKHLGDITKLNGAEVPIVDVICGGSPCQDLSVAGKRAGLAGERSGLFMEQIRIIKEMREHDRRVRGSDVDSRLLRPRYMVWENVPGALSSPGKRNGEDHRGEDFQAVLTEIVRIVKADAPDVPLPKDRRWPNAGCFMGIGEDGQPFSLAYRIHDAQFWGVAQRRKRIALVADFGGLTAPEILFERESVSRDSAESGEQRQGVAATSKRDPVKAISFQERAGCAGGGKGILIQKEHTGALSTLNNQSVCYGIGSYDSNSMRSANPHSGIYEADTSRTLDLNGGSPACNQGGMAVVCLNDQGGSVMSVSKDVTGTLRAQEHGHQPIVIEGNGSRPSHQCDGYKESEVSYTLNSTEQHAVCYESIEGGAEPITASKAGFFLNARNNGKADTLVATDYKDPQVICYGLDRASFNQGKNAQYDFSVTEEKAQTLVAKGPGGVLTRQSGPYVQEITKE